MRAAEAPLWSLSDAELVGLHDETRDLLTRVEAARLEVLAELAGRGVVAGSGAANPAAWVRGRDKLSGPAASTTVKVAAFTSGPEGAPLRRALWEAAVNTEQAGAITAVMASAPASATPSVRSRALHRLIGYADDFDAVGLRALGVGIWAAVDPDAADADEQARLLAQERRARRRRGLVGLPDGDGGIRIRGSLPAAQWSTVRTALSPLAAPRPTAADGSDPRTGAQREADALVELARRALAAGDLPDDGGDPPQLVLTTTVDALREGHGPARYDDGTRISVTAARQAACDAILVSVLLDRAGVPLSVGRRQRLFRRANRRALILRDRGCAFLGCDRPPAWCQAHHIIPWQDGGKTSLHNGVLLCGHHHRLIHTTSWEVRLAADRHPEFLPPAWIDSHRKPLRNHAHDATRN